MASTLVVVIGVAHRSRIRIHRVDVGSQSILPKNHNEKSSWEPRSTKVICVCHISCGDNWRPFWAHDSEVLSSLLKSPPLIRCFSHAFITTYTPMTSGHKEKGDTEDGGLRWSTGVSRKKITLDLMKDGIRAFLAIVWPKLIRISSTQILQLAGVFVKPIHWMWDFGAQYPRETLDSYTHYCWPKSQLLVKPPLFWLKSPFLCMLNHV